MEKNGIQNAIGALNIPTGNLRAAQAVYENFASNRKPITGRDAKDRGSTESYSVSISTQGQQLAKANFRRDQQREAADFKQKEQQENTDFNQEQMRAEAEFKRQERQKETEFRRNQQQDALAFKREQQQKEAGFQRQFSPYANQDATKQGP